MANDEIKAKYLAAARRADAINRGQAAPPPPREAPERGQAESASGASPVGGRPPVGRSRAQARRGGGCLRVLKWLVIIAVVAFAFLLWLGWSIEQQKAAGEEDPVGAEPALVEPETAPQTDESPAADAGDSAATPSVDPGAVRPADEPPAPQPEVGYMAQLANVQLVSDESPDAAPAAPSFTCPGTDRPAELFAKSEIAICGDPALAALDLKLSALYQDAIRRDSATASLIRTEQKRWMEQRNECEDSAQCLKQSYEYRIEKLEAQ